MREAEALFAGNREKYDVFRFSPAVRAGDFVLVSSVIGQTSEGTTCVHPRDEFRAASGCSRGNPRHSLCQER